MKPRFDEHSRPKISRFAKVLSAKNSVPLNRLFRENFFCNEHFLKILLDFIKSCAIRI